MKKTVLIAVTIALALSSVSKAAEVLGYQSIPHIVATHKDNELRFKRDYAGKRLSFSSTFAGAREGFGGIRVTFGSGNIGQTDIDCKMETTNPMVAKIIDWRKGLRVNVEGTIYSVFVNDITLTDCTLEPVK
jgi:hypothetical protein